MQFQLFKLCLVFQKFEVKYKKNKIEGKKKIKKF